MSCDPGIRNRRSIRLKGYDYTLEGAYFVTVCSQNRKCLFGDIIDGEMHLNDAGKILQMTRDALPNHDPHIELDEYVIMPDHFHGIIMLRDTHPPPDGRISNPPVYSGGGGGDHDFFLYDNFLPGRALGFLDPE